MVDTSMRPVECHRAHCICRYALARADLALYMTWLKQFRSFLLTARHSRASLDAAQQKLKMVSSVSRRCVIHEAWSKIPESGQRQHRHASDVPFDELEQLAKNHVHLKNTAFVHISFTETTNLFENPRHHEQCLRNLCSREFGVLTL